MNKTNIINVLKFQNFILYFFTQILSFVFYKILVGMANRVDPDETAPVCV